MGAIDTLERNTEVVAEVLADDRIKWLEDRRSGIGGSDAASVLSLSPWRSPYEVWADKVGLTAIDATDGGSLRMRCGQLMEPVIGTLFTEDTGIAVQKYPFIVRSKEWPWMIVNLDFVADSPEALLEAKTTDARFAKKWEDEEGNAAVPDNYMIQGQHECAVTGFQTVYFGVLIGGNDFRIIEVQRDDALIENLAAAERKFWTMVEERTAPAVDGSDSTTRTLRAIYQESTPGTSVDLPESSALIISGLMLAKAQKKDVETTIKGFENGLKAIMGDAEQGYLDGRLALTWKSHTVKEHVVAEGIRRPLSIK
jgi:putative phage-type endonuclease